MIGGGGMAWHKGEFIVLKLKFRFTVVFMNKLNPTNLIMASLNFKRSTKR